MGDEASVLVPPSVGEVDVPGLLHKGRCHDRGAVEVGPPLALPGVRCRADGGEVHGVVVIEVTDEPRAWGGCLTAQLNLFQFLVRHSAASSVRTSLPSRALVFF